jgi:hypothetical protein
LRREGLAADNGGLDDSRARRDFCHPVMRLISRAAYAALVPNRFEDFWRERSTRQAKTEVAVEWAEKTIQKDFKKAVKAVGKPSKKEEKKIDKITKHLSKKEKI